MDEMTNVDQPKENGVQPSRLKRSDIFNRVAGNHLSRRDMVKASVVAGGLMWSAPMLLSGNKAEAQVTCCPAGASTVTVTIAPDGTIGCGTPTCLVGLPPCDPDILACIDDFVSVNLQLGVLGILAAMVITLSGGATLSALAANTTGGLLLTDGCAIVDGCPTVGASVGPVAVTAAGLITVVNTPLLYGNLEQIELEICVPGTASGLCA